MERHMDYQVKGVSTGTTILAVTYNGGVIIGSDSRASIGGSYVSSKAINKLIQVHDKIFCCIAGSLADAQAVTKAAKFQLSFHSIQMESPPLVKAAASVLKELCYSNKEELQAGFITAGWDKKKGPQLDYCSSLAASLPATAIRPLQRIQNAAACLVFNLSRRCHVNPFLIALHWLPIMAGIRFKSLVYVVSLGGMLLEQPFTIGGSGSTYIYGYVDAKYKPNMSREECQQFATNTLALAMGRDNVSGGVVHLVVITETGVEHVVIPGDKLPKFHDE